MADSDNQIELKKRARRRLVGSAALALTAAIVLPMVMDHEPKPLTQDIQIHIPSQDTGAPLKPSAAAPKALDKVSDADGASAKGALKEAPTPAFVVPPAAEEAKTAPALADKATKPAHSESGKPAVKTESKAEAKPKPEAKVKARVAPKVESKAADAKAERTARVEAILAGDSEAAPAAAASSKFVVQLGAFSDPANAAKVRQRVKAAGYSAYTEVLKGEHGSQTRVRAGPFASREAAEQATTRLKQSGLTGVVAAK